MMILHKKLRKVLLKSLKLKFFKNRLVETPLSEETGERVNSLSPVFLFSEDRHCSLKIKYQHIRYFPSAVRYGQAT